MEIVHFQICKIISLLPAQREVVEAVANRIKLYVEAMLLGDPTTANGRLPERVEPAAVPARRSPAEQVHYPL